MRCFVCDYDVEKAAYCANIQAYICDRCVEELCIPIGFGCDNCIRERKCTQADLDKLEQSKKTRWRGSGAMQRLKKEEEKQYA